MMGLSRLMKRVLILTAYLLLVATPLLRAQGQGNQSLPAGAAGPITLNNVAGGGANDLTLGIENQVRWACSLSSLYRFQTVVAAVADIIANTTAGGIVEICPGHRETFTSQLDLGSTTKTVTLLGHPDVNLTCNVTAGSPSVCLNVHNGSAVVGLNNGSQGTGTGGFTITLASTASVAAVINTPEGLSGQSGQAYIHLENFFLQGPGSSGGTVAEMINLEGITGNVHVSNIFIARCNNTVGVRVASNDSNGVGPFVLENVFSDCSHNAGFEPLLITDTDLLGKTVLNIDVLGGFYNHPGAGLPNIEINGHGNTTSVRGMRLDTYVENANPAGGSLNVKIVDASNIDIRALRGIICGNNCTAADTLIDISESSALSGATSNIHVEQANASCGGNTCNKLVNHISGDTFTNVNVTDYIFGGDSGANFTPAIVSMASHQALNVATPYFAKSLLNSEMDIDYNNSLSVAGQKIFLRYFDHTVSDSAPQMCSGMTGTYSYVIVEGNCAGSTNYAFQDIPNTQVNLNAFGATGIEFNARANSAGPPSRWFSGGATPIEIGRFDATGNIFLGCHTTTFQNCTELTATAASGGASAAVITIPGTTGTACVSASPCSATTYGTATNCSSSASPAVCGSAAAGSVALPTNAVSSSIQVNTTAVTANSQIFAFADDTLGTKLGITCNSTLATLVGGLTISARTAGTSFTIANNVAVVTNALCVSYWIVN